MSLLGIRWNDWKFSFAEQRAAPATWDLWRDPFERVHVESVNYNMWIREKQFAIVPVAEYAAEAAASFKEYPPRGAPANYSLDGDQTDGAAVGAVAANVPAAAGLRSSSLR